MPIFDNRYTGLAPTMLVIIIVWAVAAVLMLTGTLVAARQIDTKVNEDITQSVPEIDQDLNNVKLAARTAVIANRIEASARPLEDQLNTVISEAESIRGRVGERGDRDQNDIQSTVFSINGNVRRIQSQVFSIGGTVRGIGGGVAGIAGSVLAIRGSVVGIQNDLRGILSTARGIDISRCPTPAKVEDERRVAGTRPVTSVCGVHGINARGDIGINTVGGIFDDLHNVREEVGDPANAEGHVFDGNPPARATIHGHANSIDCRIDELTTIPIVGGNINPSGPSQYCNQ